MNFQKEKTEHQIYGKGPVEPVNPSRETITPQPQGLQRGPIEYRRSWDRCKLYCPNPNHLIESLNPQVKQYDQTLTLLPEQNLPLGTFENQNTPPKP
ncbi:conserved hypothetical protein [Ricinus communis]|uniref:Uncharacterized protein n=1 Tax=Ricinus communis TaxID=3988 RepID=B9SZP5_RICCO|nr:conserved hypothetical protein [Ricinus communis]